MSEKFIRTYDPGAYVAFDKIESVFVFEGNDKKFKVLCETLTGSTYPLSGCYQTEEGAIHAMHTLISRWEANDECN